MSEESAIQVNFGKPMPIFPLDSAALLPQQVLPLHIFEPRYRQMIEHAIDGAGQIAMAVFRGKAWKSNYHGRPALRPAVCVGQIVQHERLADGRYNVLLQGVCRARIAEELPASQDRLYRAARLEPVGIEQQDDERLYGVRERLAELLGEGPLTRLSNAEWVMDRIRDEEIPTAVVLELVSFALPTHREAKYQLLAESDAGTRATIVEHELVGLRDLINRAAAQHPERWPKGVSWN